MNLKKAIKRIVALGTGATMVGATILGAMAAADLSNYPKPFVEGGAFDALIVFGAAAKADDVAGAVDIATSLQYSATVPKAVPGATDTKSVSGEGVKIETDSNKLTIGESLAAVKTNLDEDDLPNLLAAGTFVNDGDDENTEYGYKQKLEFGPARNASVSFLADSNYEADPDSPYLMLFGPKSPSSQTGAFFMKYTLDFTKQPESDVSASSTGCGSTDEMCDFEDTKIEIMGIEYEVTKAEYDSGAVTWEMMGGVSLNTMYEGETKTFTVSGEDYEVTVDIISDTGSADETVILSVNGESTKELEKDQTDKVAGIEVGIKQVMGNEAGEAGAGRDLVQFYLGAQKVVLSDTSVSADLDTNVKIGGTDVDQLWVDWTTSGSDPVKLDKVELTWRPDEELFLVEDSKVEFPGLKSFYVEYAGLTSAGKEEVVKIKPHGDSKIELTVPLEAGTTTFDVLYANTAALAAGNFTAFGKGTGTSDTLHIATGSAVDVGDYIVLSNEIERESHVVKLDRISTQNLTRVKDLADGQTYEATCTSACTISVGDTDLKFASVDQSASQATFASGGDVNNLVYTKGGLTINLGTSIGNASHVFAFTEEDKNGALAEGDEFNITVGVSSSKTTVSDVSDDGAVFTLRPDDGDGADGWEYGDTEDYAWYTEFGTKVVRDKTGDQDTATVYYPGEEAHANVFVNSEAATVVSGGGGSTYDEVQRIEVGAAVLDTEIASVSAQNLIVVGGPCANSVAAQLMGNPANCAAGFEMGKAMVKLFEQSNGNVALLVAGYSAMDTRRASRVVA
ncbi:MAG: hypothetical protein ABIG95_06020, partial [Candidatus Woesearchaeota archaeon]